MYRYLAWISLVVGVIVVVFGASIYLDSNGWNTSVVIAIIGGLIISLPTIYLIEDSIANKKYREGHLATEEERLKYGVSEFCPGCGQEIYVSKPIVTGYDKHTGDPSKARIEVTCEAWMNHKNFNPTNCTNITSYIDL